MDNNELLKENRELKLKLQRYRSVPIFREIYKIGVALLIVEIFFTDKILHPTGVLLTKIGMCLQDVHKERPAKKN